MENQFAELFCRCKCGSQAVMLSGFTHNSQERDWLLQIRWENVPRCHLNKHTTKLFSFFFNLTWFARLGGLYFVSQPQFTVGVQSKRGWSEKRKIMQKYTKTLKWTLLICTCRSWKHPEIEARLFSDTLVSETEPSGWVSIFETYVCANTRTDTHVLL